jgi:type II secretory pathway pseudopilin PulG
MTLVELIAAIAICAVGIMATVGVLDTSRQAANTAEARQVATQRAELELERTLALSWDVLGHPTTPVPSGDPALPSSRITNDSPRQYRFDLSNATRREVLQVITGALPGQVPSDRTAWTDGQSRLSGFTYRYVTRSANGRTRRITVVVTVNAPARVAPVLVSSLVTRPG